MRPLDFLVIGAARAGTTSLHHYLKTHPGICLPANKEAPFFATPTEYDGDWERVGARLFSSGTIRGDRLLGKVTPQYMAGSLRWVERNPPRGDPAALVGTDDPAAAATIVPQRIFEHNPQIRLVAILRDPVERAISHYRHAVHQGREARPPDMAFARALDPEDLARARLLPSECVSAYIAFGEYARILGGYRSVFGGDRLLVLPFLEFVGNPAEAVRRILRFLGLSDHVSPTATGGRFNGSDSVPRFRVLDTRTIERRADESRLGRRLWAKLPPGPRRLIDIGFARLTELDERHNRTAETRTGSEPPYERARELLRRHYGPWNEELVAL